MQRLIMAFVGLSAAAAVPFVLAGGDSCSTKANPTAGTTLVSTSGGDGAGSGCCPSQKAETLVSTAAATAAKACPTEKTATVSTGGGSCTSGEKASTVSTGACTAEKAATVSTGGSCSAEKAATVSTGGSCSSDKAATVSTGGGACSSDKAATVSTGDACTSDKAATVSTGGDHCATDKAAATVAEKSDCCPSEKSATLVSTGDAAKPFDTLKGLVGRWESAKPVEGMPTAAIEFKVSSNGSAIVETMFPGQQHEMLNMYVMDGDDLLMTHYCAAGNQPRMKLVSNDGKTMKFAFVDATNLKDKNGSYMGELELTILGPDLIKEKWASFDKGQVATHAEFELKRVK